MKTTASKRKLFVTNQRIRHLVISRPNCGKSAAKPTFDRSERRAFRHSAIRSAQIKRDQPCAGHIERRHCGQRRIIENA
jgi:hypothetical protein